MSQLVIFPKLNHDFMLQQNVVSQLWRQIIPIALILMCKSYERGVTLSA